MSSPNQLTDDAVLAELQRTLDQNTQNQSQRIKVGNQEFEPSNIAGIQEAITNALNANKNEFDTLKNQIAQLTNSRTVDTKDDNNQQQTQQTPQTQTLPPTAPKRSRSVTDEEWSQEFIKAPQRVIDETLARMLGVEGSGSQALINAFTTLGTELQQAKLQNQALLAKAQELDQKITATEARTEAQQFIDSHEDYEINPDNQRVMEQYLTEYGLAPTARNLGLVFNQAKADGKIQAKQTQQTQQQQFTPQLKQGMPRLGGQSAPNIEDNAFSLLEQANKLPLDQHAALIERLRNGQFQR